MSKKRFPREKPDMAMISVGSVANGPAWSVVVVSAGNKKVHYTALTPDGARLVGRHLAEWADHVEKLNNSQTAPNGWMQLFKDAGYEDDIHYDDAEDEETEHEDAEGDENSSKAVDDAFGPNTGGEVWE